MGALGVAGSLAACAAGMAYAIAAAREDEGRRARDCWALLAAGTTVWAGAGVAWVAGGAGAPTMGVAIAWLASLTLDGAAMALYPGAPRHASGRGRTLVDGLIVTASTLLIAWSVGLDDLYAAGSDPASRLAL